VSTDLVRQVTKDGRPVARLHCYDDDDGGTVVEAQVLPKGESQPVRRGPYRFATAQEATRFVQEALLALQYLGCQAE
jgi:hypothetical protein